MTVNIPMTRSDRVASLEETKASRKRVEMPGRAAYRPACSGGLAIGIAMASAATAAAVHAQQLDQKLLLFLGFGLRDPTHGLFGILAESIGP